MGLYRTGVGEMSGKRVTVIGAKRSGLAAARLLRDVGARVFVSDAGSIDEEVLTELAALGFRTESGGHTPAALECDLIVLSPGVPSQSSVVVEARRNGIPVISEIELAYRHCAAPIVAITGSNGKTTTTSLAGHLVGGSGRRTWVAGNIGAPFSGVALDTKDGDAVVLEVSSFQLDHIERFRPRVSAILNITPDHLDRYGGSFEAYAASKRRIYENQRDDDALILNVDDEMLQPLVGPTTDRLRLHEISLDREVAQGGFLHHEVLVIRTEEGEMQLPVEEVPLKGRHNLYNTLAAAVAARIMEVRSDVIRESMASFKGVPHRLEFVREHDGVRYYNDSKATNVNAVWYALESFTEPIVLIAGGRDKGNDYGPLRNLVRRRVRLLIAIGEGAPKLIDELGSEAGRAMEVGDLDTAVKTARVLAQEGDVVLLSPACASFDQFDNYEHRGDSFKRLVASL